MADRNQGSSAPSLSGGSLSSTVPNPNELSFPSRQANVLLFDVHLSTLSGVPELEANSTNSYLEWKPRLKTWSLTNGTWDLINLDYKLMEQRAIDFLRPFGFSPDQAKVKYVSLHQRVWGSLCTAIYKATGASLPESIESEQKQEDLKPVNERKQLEFNCNYLWVKIIDTFEKKAGVATMQIHRELMELKYDRKENPLQFQQRFQTLIHKLNSVKEDVIKPGEKVSEGFKVSLLINSLDKQAQPTILAIVSTHDTLTPELFFGALKRQWDLLPTRSINPSERSSHALYVGDNEPGAQEEDGSEGIQASFRSGKHLKQAQGSRQNNRKAQNNSNSNRPARDGQLEVMTLMFLDGAQENLPDPIDDDYDSNDADQDDSQARQLALAAQDDEFLFRIWSHRGTEIILDSGASRHTVFNSDLLEDLHKVTPFYMWSVTGHHTKVSQVGALRIHEKVRIGDVHYVPNSTHNLISMAVLFDNGCECEVFTSTEIVFHKIIGKKKIRLPFRRDFGKSVWRYVLPQDLIERVRTKTPAFIVDKETDKGDEVAEAPQFKKIESRKTLSASSSVLSSDSKLAALEAPDRHIPKKATRSSIAAAQAAAKGLTQASLLVANDFFPSASPSCLKLNPIECDTSEVVDALLAFHELETDQAKLWHARIGHQNESILVEMNRSHQLQIPQSQLNGLKNCVCTGCISGKGRRSRVRKRAAPEHLATETMQRIHLDLIGPFTAYDGKHKIKSATTMGGNLYALLIVEEYSRSVHVELLKTKDEAAERVIAIVEMWQNHTGKQLKEVHCDGGGEFINDELQSYLRDNGTRLTYTTANSPWHNGIVERMNGVIMEMARAMMAHAVAPLSLWGEAMNYAAFIHNNTPQPTIRSQIPYQVLFQKCYGQDKFKVFGCDAYIYLDDAFRGKLESRFRPAVFVGFDTQQNGFRILNPDTRRVTVSRNVKMIENSFRIIQDGSQDCDLSVLDRILNQPMYPSADSIHLVAPNVQVSIPPPLMAPSEPKLDGPVDEDDSEPQLNDHEQQEVELPPPQQEPQPVPPSSPPAHDPEPSVPSVSNESVDPSPPQIKSREIKELERMNRAIKYPTSLSVPPRKAAGQNKVTHPYGKGRIQITESEPTVSKSHGRVIMPNVPKVFHLFVCEPDAQELIAAIVSGGVPFEPKTYKQAIRCEAAPHWIQAMHEELQSLERLGTWTLVPRPNGVKIITAKWVFKLKLDSNNQPVRYKARLVARGFQQTEGVDYDETFAPVVKLKSLKLILSWAADQDLEIKQIDFDTAFLNAELEHEVYMELPEGSNYPSGSVCKLLKSIYGLKQAGHDWHQLIRDEIIELGYEQLQCDTCVFIKRLDGGRMIILPLYVDDTLAIYHIADEAIWLADKAAIASHYAIKDLGDCEWILNMKLVRDRANRTITLSQEAYSRRVLETFQHLNSVPVVQPCVDYDLFDPPAGVDVTPLNKKEQTRYQAIVGSLLYAALTTRPDLSFAVNELGRFNAQATQGHLNASYHALKYLAGTTNYGLRFGPNPNQDATGLCVDIYSDASWGNDLETRKSTSGMLVLFNGNVVSWSSRKQKTVALSSTEAEYMALSEATCEALWIRTWIKEVFGMDVTINLYCDNQSAIALSSNDKFHQRTKHIDIRYHFIREKIASGEVNVVFVPTQLQFADILTKKLATGIDFARQRNRLMVQI